MKSHDEIRGMLAAMAGNDLSETDRKLVQQHLADCPSCRSELAQLKIVVQAERSIPEVEPPLWLKARIMALVREETKPKHSWLERLFLPLHVKLPIEGLALLMVCVVAWYVMQDMDRSQQVKIIAPKAQTPVSETAKDAVVPAPVPQARQAVPHAAPRSDTVVPTPVQEPSVAPSFAPPPMPARAQPDHTAQSKAEAEVVQPPSTVREQTAGGASKIAGHMVAATIRKAKKADSSLSSVTRPLLRLRVADRETVNDQLQTIAQRLGGTLVDSRPGNCVVRVEAKHLSELLEQVAGLGRVLEHPSGTLATEGIAELQVVW